MSEIDRIIPPEILDDELYRLIEALASREKLEHVLEIGSSSGAGSTSAFVRALKRNPNNPSLYCMELSKARFDALSRAYENESFVKCFNVSSVSLEEFPDSRDIANFYASISTSLNRYPLPQVEGWLAQDIEYIKTSGVRQNGIEIIKREAGIEFFDMVLIDGSEFTGCAELDHVYGASIILLDDTNAFKCWHARGKVAC